MKQLLLVFLISTLYAQEDGAIKMLRDAKHDVVITASYVAEVTRYSDVSRPQTTYGMSSTVTSLPTYKHGVQINVTFNSYLYQMACLTSMVSRGKYQELSLYLISSFLPATTDTSYLPGSWYSSFISSLAEFEGDTSTVWVFRVGRYDSGTADKVGPGGWSWDYEFQMSRTVNANESATNAPMASVLTGIVRKPKLTSLYLNWEASILAGIKANPFVKDATGRRALYLQVPCYFALLAGFSRPVGFGVVSGEAALSIDQQLDMALGGSEDQYSDNTQASSWSTLTKAKAKLSYSF